MADNSFSTNQRYINQRVSSNSKRYSESLQSPHIHEQSDSKIFYNSLSTQQQKKIFGFEIYIHNDVLKHLGNIQCFFQRIKHNTMVQQIKFNSQLTIPDLDGNNIQIYDKEMQKKYQSCKILLDEVYSVSSKNQIFSIIIFVPQGMVSLLIGAKGHQINKIMKQSKTKIVVNQPINKMTYRTVKIQGIHYDIARACRIIYQILQEKSAIAYSIQIQPSQLDYTQTKIKAKFIIDSSIASYLQHKKKYILKKVQYQTKSFIKFRQDHDNYLIRREQQLCILTGKLQDVQALIVMLINLINDYYLEDKRNIDYTLKILIPVNYVTKLIGQKGYMIRNIIQRSGGAQIKILSDRQSDKDIRQCIIAVNGSRQNKIDAICLILQQIQCFKNGGPILQSGKSINQNLAQQFKNSISMKKDQQIVNCLEEINNVKNIQQLQHLNTTTSPNSQIQLTYQNQHSPQKIIKNDIIEVCEEKSQEGLVQDTFSIPKDNGLTLERERKDRSQSLESQLFSRSREKKIKIKEVSGGRDSSSIQFNHQKEIAEIKLVIPKKLANDHKELKYIQSLCKSEIRNGKQKIQGTNESIITIRGLIKDNTQCLKLFQKRLARIMNQSRRQQQ